MSKREATNAKCTAESSIAVPRIRFKECEGEWLRYQIGDCFEERDERTADGELLSVTIGFGVIPARDNGKLDNSSADKSNYKKVCVGDLAYNSMRMWQGACGASVFAGIVSPAYTVMNPKAGHDSLFYQYLFKTDEILRIFQSRSQGMTSDTWNLKFPLLKEIALNVPLLKEQKYVAAFFSDLEKEIASAIARGNKLRQLKQSMLVKMFPQRGKTVPEVRFSEFKGEWKLRRICECFDERNERSADGELLSVTIGKGVICATENGKLDNSSSDKSNYKVVRKGDVAYNSMRMWQGACGASKFDGIVSPAYTVIVPHSDIHSEYVEFYFKTTPVLTIFRVRSQGMTSDTWNLKFQALKDISLKFPTRAEQQKIGSFFKNLDSLIAAAEKRVAKLRQVKASLLERMFV